MRPTCSFCHRPAFWTAKPRLCRRLFLCGDHGATILAKVCLRVEPVEAYLRRDWWTRGSEAA